MHSSASNGQAGAVDVIVIGAGHCGLAMSRFLSSRSIDHLILERGEIANSWLTERWDSLKLLTPNWLSRLPGYRFSGPNPDGYMSMHEVVGFIQGYATFSRAPVLTGTTVTSVVPSGNGYRVNTNRGEWRAGVLVIASGPFSIPLVPALSAGLPSTITQLTAKDYRNPQQLPDGGVLVVGASASGLQLAAEIHSSGRPVTLAAGEHVRMPRVYRGKDIQYWMHVTGLLDQRYDEVDDINRARHVPSPQLVGSHDRRTLDLNELSAQGIRLTGRLAGVRDSRVQFSGSLRHVCKLADLKMNRLLDTIDEWIAASGARAAAKPGERPAPTMVCNSPCLGLDLTSGEVKTVLWATGFRPDYSWLQVPVLDRKGHIRHDGGISAAPGMYVMGLPYLRRRKSSFIHGAEDDARDLSEHLVNYLHRTSSASQIRIAV